MKITQTNLNKLFESLSDSQVACLCLCLCEGQPSEVAEKLKEYTATWSSERKQNAAKLSIEQFADTTTANQQSVQWFKADPAMVLLDEYAAKFNGFVIRLAIPNGGIIGASVEDDSGRCWFCSTEEFDKFSDREWHLQQARSFIGGLL